MIFSIFSKDSRHSEYSDCILFQDVPPSNVNDLRYTSGAPLRSVCMPMYVSTRGMSARVTYRAGSRKIFNNRTSIIALIISHFCGFTVVGFRPDPKVTLRTRSLRTVRKIWLYGYLRLVSVAFPSSELVEIRRCRKDLDSHPSILRFNILLPILPFCPSSSSFFSRYKNT